MKHLQVEDISVRFGRVQALRSVSLDLEAGRVMMLIGPNGAGKSTLMHVILGLVRADRGVLRVDGQPRSVDRELKGSLGYLPEAVSFSEVLTGRQVLRFFARARGVAAGRIAEVLERVGLTAAAGRRVSGYSRGMRQRLGLAVAILGEPHLLILDEPTSGFDQEGLDVLWSVLDRWRELGRMVLLSSHDLALMEHRVDEVVVFQKGRVLAAGEPSELCSVASLPTTITLDLRANAPSAKLLGDLDASSIVARQPSRLKLEIDHARLLEVVGPLSEHRDEIVDVRVEEATLSAVYEHLLEGAS